MIKAIDQCRVCGNPDLDPVINIGRQFLTGVFPKQKNQPLTSGPLELVRCREKDRACCGLLQLKHSYDAHELYGDHYGYRSSLNQSMVRHLQDIVKKILGRVELGPEDIVLDIGSNDSTLLQAYPRGQGQLVGMDPSAGKFRKYYPAHVALIDDFFSAAAFRKRLGQKKAKVVTSIAMFYDLPDPMAFMRDVHEILSDDGIWVFEQSYMPTMIHMLAYDTICHEHFEYYGLKQIKWMADRAGFKIIDVQFNDTNGGSFQVTVAKEGNRRFRQSARIAKILIDEELLNQRSFKLFEQNVRRHRDQLTAFVQKAGKSGKRIFGYGASTKGNVILQYCGFTAKDISCIAEVNEDKFGCFTPGTGIPIVSEVEARAQAPDYFLVLPWHFRDSIVAREQAYLKSGGTLVFPLPHIEAYS